MPVSRATATAVSRWSPVIITGVIPTLRQTATAATASGRGGSIIPARPRKTMSRSVSSSLQASPATWRQARPSTRRASWAMAALAVRISARSASSRGTVRPFWSTPAQRSRTVSGAPFMKAMRRPSSRAWSVVMRLRSELNGSSSRRGFSRRVRALGRPALTAATTRAASVGSPWMRQAPSRSSRSASLQSSPARSRRRRASESAAPLSAPSGA